METSDIISSRGTAIGAEALSTFHLAPRPSENPSQFLGSSLAPMEVPMANAGSGKKKRGRPRKNEANGALLPMQISPSAPLVKKRGRGKLNGLDMKMHKKRMGFHTSGNLSILTH